MAREDWKIVVLEHDEGSKQIGELIGELFPGITEVREISDRLEYKTDVKEAIKKSVDVDRGYRVLTLYGYGGRHHYTYGLCKEVADKRSDGYAYIHFDHHTDFGLSGYDNGWLNCGAFVHQILNDSNAQGLRYVGCRLIGSGPETMGELKKWTYASMDEKKGDVKKHIRELIQDTPNDVYISLDLDVLDSTEMKTGFDSGALRLKELMEALDVIKNERNVISADALGYYTGFSDKTSLLTYVEIVEKITDRKLDPNVKVEAVKKIRKMYEPAYEENTIERLSTLMKVKRIYEMLKSKLTDG